MSTRAWDAVVIGSGIHGAGAAYFLSRAGWRVLIVEAGEAGSGTSSSTNANLALHNRDPLQPEFPLAFHTPAMYEGLQEELSTDLEFSRRGGLMLADEASDLENLRERAARQAAAGLRVEMLDATMLRQRDSVVAADLLGGVYCADSAWVNPLLVVAAYVAALRRRGGHIWTNTPATAIRTERGRVVGVETPRGVAATEWVINAAGPNAGAVAAMAGVPFAITPVWGQLLVTAPVAPTGVAQWNEAAIVRGHARDGFAVRFLATRLPSGNLLIGRCELRGEMRRRVIPEAIPQVLRRAIRFLPLVGGLRILRIFAGVRPFSPDGRPAIGPVPEPHGFALLAGFGDKGIGQGIAAKLLAQALCGEHPEISLDAFAPDRFYSPMARADST